MAPLAFPGMAAPLFLTAIHPELVCPSTATAAIRPKLVFRSTATTAIRPELVFSNTAMAAFRPKLVFPSTATAAVCPELVFPSTTAAIRVQTGMDYGGLRLLSFKLASLSMGAPKSLPRFWVKSSKAGQDSEGSEQEISLVTRLEYMRNWLPTPIHPEELTNLKDGETVLLSALREVADRGYTLVKEVSYHMRPMPASPLFEDLFGVGIDFLGSGTLVVHPVGLSMLLVARLDTLRRIVSSACHKPLPPALIHQPESLMDDSLDKEIVQLVKNVCSTVEDDVKAMISTSY